jgi:2-desacetyl-2-hydroxyethyl bacteriochlorophyllide A dehydrogenase
MLKVRVSDIKKISYEQVGPQQCDEDQAIIDVHTVGICGSDMHVYLGKNPVLKPPRVQGHEFGGTVKELRNDGGFIKKGDRVAVNPVVSCGKCYYCKRGEEYLCENAYVIGGEVEGAMQEEIAVPLKNLVVLPESFDLNFAPLIEPTSVAVHTVNIRPVSNANVLIIGLGTIGILIQQVSMLNKNRVVSVDKTKYSLDLSKKFGAELTLNAQENNNVEKSIIDFLGEDKIDVVYDTVCSPKTIQMAINVVRKRGSIVVVGIAPKNFVVDVLGILCKEIKIFGSYLYTHKEYEKAAEYVINETIKVKELLSKTFSLKEAEKAYEYKLNVPSIKVAVVV